MYYIKDTGYVVKRHSANEADKYITILTQNNGKMEVLAKGIRKLSSRRAGSLELLNKISFQAVGKSKDSRMVLADVRLVEAHSSLKKTLDHLKVLFTVCELISVLCPHGQKHEDVFFLLDKTMFEMRGNVNSTIQSFQVSLLSLLGYWDTNRAFINASDIENFTEGIMERKIKSSEFFRNQA